VVLNIYSYIKTKDLYQLRALANQTDETFLHCLQESKKDNKIRLAALIKKDYGIDVDIDSMFDCHIKRIHEYKRQLLNVFHIITLYNEILDNPNKLFVKRTIMFGGKAAPGYNAAKTIIKLINSVAKTVNENPIVSKFIKIVFFENYRVS